MLVHGLTGVGSGVGGAVVGMSVMVGNAVGGAVVGMGVGSAVVGARLVVGEKLAVGAVVGGGRQPEAAFWLEHFVYVHVDSSWYIHPVAAYEVVYVYAILQAQKELEYTRRTVGSPPDQELPTQRQ